MTPFLLVFQLATTMTAYTECYAEVMQLPFSVMVEFEDMGEDLAQTEVEVDYLTASIKYSLEALAEEPDAALRRTVVHELIHVLTWELGLLADEVDLVHSLTLFEQIATRVERWPFWLKVCT